MKFWMKDSSKLFGLWISSKLESQVYSLGTSNFIRITVYQRLWYVIGFISTQITLNGCQGRPVASFTDKISLSIIVLRAWIINHIHMVKRDAIIHPCPNFSGGFAKPPLNIGHGFVITSSSPFYQHGLTLIPAWISNHMPCKVWDEITYPFLNFNGCTVEV